MKAYSKIAIVAFSLNLLIPTATLAHEAEVHSTTETLAPKAESTFSGDSKTQDPNKFCINATKIRENISTSANGKAEKLKADFDKRTASLTTKRAELVKKISANRLKSDTERTKRFAELEAKAKTDSQMAAVKTYEAAVLAAVAKHRAAIDAADKTFLDGVTTAVGSRQTQLTALSASYQAGVAAAVAQAKTSCAAGVAGTAVRQNLSVSLKALQAKFADGRKSLEKVRPNLDPLKDAHKAAIKQANEDFRDSLKTAYTKLKAALAPASPSPSPSA